MKMPFVVRLVLAIALSGCGFSESFSNTAHDTPPESTTLPPSNITPNRPIQYGVLGTFTATQEVANNPVTDIVFLLDNSYSMSDELTRLRNSVSGLISQLQSSNVRYRLRFIPFSQFNDLTKSTSVGLANFTRANGSAGSILKDMGFTSGTRYAVPVFDMASSLSELNTQVQSLSTIDNTFSEEHGLALAADYLHWSSVYTGSANPQPLRQRNSVHFVVLSNEDNSATLNGNPSYLHSEKYYAGTAPGALGTCQQQGFYNVPNTDPNVVNYQRYSSPIAYVLSDRAAAVGMSTLPIAGVYSAVGTSTCEYDSTRSFWTNSPQWASTKKVCSVRSSFYCPKTVDGVIKWQVSSDLNAVTSACRPCADGTNNCAGAAFTYNWVPNANTSVPVVDSTTCATVTCETVLENPTTIYSVIRNTDKTVSITKKALGANQTEIIMPSGITTFVADVCPNQLAGSLPAGLSITARTSSNAAPVPFRFVAGENMARAEALSAIASLHSTAVANLQITREPSASTTRLFAETPTGFTSFINALHSDLNEVVWHSIVGNGTACNTTVVGGEYSTGNAYNALSDLTRGVKENLCNTSYDGFIQRLSESITYRAIRRYALNSPDLNRVVKIKSLDINPPGEYAVEKDFVIQNGEIVFLPAVAVIPGDRFEALYEM